jgi:hypothetical protein
MANMNNKNKTRPQRIDPEFIKEMKEMAKFRYMKGLAKEEPKFAEMTRLLRRTEGWKTSVFELKTKPKKQ